MRRKFGDIDHNKALQVFSGIKRRMEAPLNPSAYENMNLENWRKSMIKYNENYESTEWLKKDIHQHSIAFRDKVKEYPDQFYNFINELFEDKRVSTQYIIWGIEGLIDGNYNPDKVKFLFKKIMFLNPDDAPYMRMLNHQANYFTINKNIDLEIVNYLQNTVLNYPNKEKEHNPKYPLHDAINSIRGLALYILMFCCYDKDYEEIIFSTIEKIIKNSLCNDSLKFIILHNLGYLNYLNIERAFKIFVELTNTNNVEILKSSLNTAQYFNNKYHDDMGYYFEALLNTPELYKQSYILVSSWLLGLDDNKKLYQRFISTGKESKLCAIHVAEKFLIDEDNTTVNSDALSILYELIDEKDKNIANEYASIILRRFKPNNFTIFLDFLKEYSKSQLCKTHPNYFLQYLLKCSKDHPQECMELLENMDFSSIPNIQESAYYDKEPIQLILGIYSKLVSEIKKNKNLINKALDVFDDMLRHEHLRSSANQAIETII